MDTITLIIRSISFLTAFIVSLLLVSIAVKDRRERNLIAKKLEEMDHLDRELHPNYVVLVFNDQQEKNAFALSIGGDTEHNTFHARYKCDGLERKSQ